MNARRVCVIALSALAVTLDPSAARSQGDADLIAEGSTVTINYTLTLADETKVGGTEDSEPVTYTQGASQILPALEAALLGHKVGDDVHVELAVDEAYGPVNPEAFDEVPLDSVPEDARAVGTILVATDPSGQRRQLRVHELRPETIVLDFNHPLAGEALTFDVTILTIE